MYERESNGSVPASAPTTAMPPAHSGETLRQQALESLRMLINLTRGPGFYSTVLGDFPLDKEEVAKKNNK